MSLHSNRFRNVVSATLLLLGAFAAACPAQIESLGDEPALADKDKPVDPAEPAVDEFESVLEDAAGETDFEKWLEPKCAFRRVVTLTPVPQFEKPDVAAIGGLSLRRLSEYGQLGSGIVARTGAGAAVEVLTDPAGNAVVVRIPDDLRNRAHVQLALYYGDGGAMPAVKPLGRPLSDAESKAYNCFLGTEEARDGDKSDAAQRSIARYASFYVIEPRSSLKSQPTAGAHRGTVAALSENDQRVEFEPTNVEPGEYLVRIRLHAPSRVEAKVELDYTAGEASRNSRALTGAGAGFFWVETIASVGRDGWNMQVRGPGDAVAGLSVDCMTLSRDVTWKPDYESLSGPTWVRFRLPAGAERVESLDLVATHTTYTENGPLSSADGSFAQNAWFQTPGMRKLFPPRRLKAKFEAGKWTPWGRLRERGSYTWFETLTLKGSQPLPESIEIQLALEPYTGAVFRHEKAEVFGGQFYFRMPMTPDDFHDAMNFARTFQDLINVRSEWVKASGLTGSERPRKLAFSVFHDTELSDRMHEKTLAMMTALGFNGVDQPNPKYAEQYTKAGFDSHHDHAWIDSLDADWDNLPGTTYTEKLEAYRKQVVETVPTWRPSLDLSRFNILGDEIGPAVDEGAMHESPGLHRLFVTFCKERGATPGEFGLKDWSEIRWPVPVLGKIARKAARQKEFDRIAAEAVTDTALGEKVGDDLALEESDEDAIKARAAAGRAKKIEDLADERIDKRRQEGVVVVPDPASAAGKRLRWYVRLFQSDFTARTYHAHAEAIHRKSKVKTISGPNFQAEPVHSGRMWDGGLDVLTYGRLGGPHAMVQIEDWVGPQAFANCAYAGALIRAACRTSGAFPAALVTGGQSRPKIVAWLSQGIRKFDSYTYGPIHRIGPVWADDRASYGNIGHTLAAIGRVEEDVLACTPRNDVALLVDNTSEITKKTGGMNRIAMFAALTYAGFQPDVIGEDDILLDGRLKQYKAVVVVDEAVRNETQDALAKWGSAGGNVYVVPGAAAVDQFEQPTDVLKPFAQPAADDAALRKELRAFASKAGALETVTCDDKRIWASTAQGDARQVVYVVRGEGDANDARLNVRRTSRPREVVSAFHGPIKDFAFNDGRVEFSLRLAPLDADIIVLRD